MPERQYTPHNSTINDILWEGEVDFRTEVGYPVALFKISYPVTYFSHNPRTLTA